MWILNLIWIVCGYKPLDDTQLLFQSYLGSKCQTKLCVVAKPLCCLCVQICLGTVCRSFPWRSVSLCLWRVWTFTRTVCGLCQTVWSTYRPSPTWTSGNTHSVIRSHIHTQCLLTTRANRHSFFLQMCAHTPEIYEWFLTLCWNLPNE